MTNTKTLEIEELYDEVLDGMTSPLEELLENRRVLLTKIVELNKVIQNSILLNRDYMISCGFTADVESDIKSFYYKGKYKIEVDLLDVTNIKVYNGTSHNNDPFIFKIITQQDFQNLLKMLCI